MMIIQDPAELLQDVVDEAARLLGSSGAVIDLLDPATGEVHWAYDAGIDDETRAEWQRRGAAEEGVFLAIRERRVVTTDDYAADERFADGAANADFFAEPASARSRSRRSSARRRCSARSRCSPPRSAGSGRPGGDPRRARRPRDDRDPQRGADRRAGPVARGDRPPRETERTLREIAARVTSIRDPEAILGLIVDETRRVLGSDGAHLTRMSEDRTFLRPVVISGGMDEETRDWSASPSSRSTAGSTASRPARAGSSGPPTTPRTRRIPRDEEDLDVAERLGLGAMAAAPAPRAPAARSSARSPISYRQPGSDLARPAGDAPGARRPRGDRALELGPARPAGGVETGFRASSRRRPTSSGATTPRAGSRSWPRARSSCSAGPRTTSSAATSRTSSPPSRRRRGRRGRARSRPRAPCGGCASSWCARTGRPSRPRRPPSRASTARSSRRPGDAPDISERERLERELRSSRGAVPRPRPVVAGPHLRDGRQRGLHVLLRPHRGGHRLVAGRDDRPPVHRLHRHGGVPHAGAADRGDRGQPGQAVHRPAAHPPQARRPQDPVRGQRRRPGRRAGPAWPRSAVSPATSASGSASRTSSARPRSATGSSSRTPPTSCSRPDADARFLFFSDTIERLTGSGPRRPSARRSTRSSPPRRCRSRLSAGDRSPTRSYGPVLRLDIRTRTAAPSTGDPLVGQVRRARAVRWGPRLRARSASESASRPVRDRGARYRSLGAVIAD